MDTPADATVPNPERCGECQKLLAAGEDRETTARGVFCRSCFSNLSAVIDRAIEAQGQDITNPLAVLGGVAGGAVGALAWWGFTVLTEYNLGLVAIVIGIGVGKGIIWCTGGKRARSLQLLSVVLAALAFVYASYLVDRSFILRALGAVGQTLPLLPGPGLFVEILRAGFQPFDLVFLGITVYEAWKIPAPFKLKT